VTEISARYAALGGAFAAAVAAVPAQRWEAQSPCEEWTARDVVRHVVDTQGMFLSMIGGELGPIPSVDEDPAAAWEAALAVVLEALEDPQRAAMKHDGLFGPMRFEEMVDTFLAVDQIVHRWDIARATGGDERLTEEEMALVRRRTEQFGEHMRREGAFPVELTPPDGADAQTRLLAFLGRRAW
jgi:uncharacterized protein (TIGR03086 family)